MAQQQQRDAGGAAVEARADAAVEGREGANAKPRAKKAEPKKAPVEPKRRGKWWATLTDVDPISRVSPASHVASSCCASLEERVPREIDELFVARKKREFCFFDAREFAFSRLEPLSDMEYAPFELGAGADQRPVPT